MSKHTETPWRIWNHEGAMGRDGIQKTDIKTDGGLMIHVRQPVIGRSFPELTANIEFIVRAVNAHEELLSIVKDILPDDHSDYSDGERCDECGMRRESSDQTECDVPGCWYVRVREAIAKAEGGA